LLLFLWIERASKISTSKRICGCSGSTSLASSTFEELRFGRVKDDV
jgi:hypothetical protein